MKYQDINNGTVNRKERLTDNQNDGLIINDWR